MPLNSTVEEINAQADKDFKNKLKLERQIERELRSLFNEMSRDMDAFVSITRQAPEATLYEDELRGIFSRQAKRVSKAFQNQLFAFIDSVIGDLDESIIRNLNIVASQRGITLSSLVDELKASVQLQLREFNKNIVDFNTQSVLKTNKKEMDLAVAQILADNPDISRTELAKQSSQLFKQKSIGRITTIATTFTQDVAENTKFIERQGVLNVANGFDVIAAGGQQLKEEEWWVSRADSVVRLAHLVADFTQKVGRFFIVDNENLRFPGDRAFGASAKNTINCRCSSVLSIE